MDTFIGLLRGINVGGRNKVPMQDLRSLCADIGWSEVQSYIQSGNLVFKSASDSVTLEADLEKAIEQRFGLSIPVVIRTAANWSHYIGKNPYPDVSEQNPKHLMLVLSKDESNSGVVEELQKRAAGGERITQVDDALWIHFASGVARSKLSTGVMDRLVGSPVTARNWRTVLKLDQLARGL